MSDSVNHPAHYNTHPAGVECIDVIEWMPANCANAFKYLWRCDLKHPSPDEDLRKAIWYLEREFVRRDYLHRTATGQGGVLQSLSAFAFYETMRARRISRSKVCGAFPKLISVAMREIWKYCAYEGGDLMVALAAIQDERTARALAAEAAKA